MKTALNTTLGQYFTPKILAKKIAEKFVSVGDRVLEPTAGDGVLVKAALAAGAASVHAVEYDPRFAPALDATGAESVVIGDVRQKNLLGYDLALANPPDAARGGLPVLDFLQCMTTAARECVALVRLDTVTTLKRAKFWSTDAQILGITMLANRPIFSGGGGRTNWCVVHWTTRGDEDQGEIVLDFWFDSWK